MTPSDRQAEREAQAREHREKLRLAIDNMERTEVCLDIFDRALAANERAVWEEAAKEIDNVSWWHMTVPLEAFQDWLRQRAQEVDK